MFHQKPIKTLFHRTSTQSVVLFFLVILVYLLFPSLKVEAFEEKNNTPSTKNLNTFAIYLKEADAPIKIEELVAQDISSISNQASIIDVDTVWNPDVCAGMKSANLGRSISVFVDSTLIPDDTTGVLKPHTNLIIVNKETKQKQKVTLSKKDSIINIEQSGPDSFVLTIKDASKIYRKNITLDGEELSYSKDGANEVVSKYIPQTPKSAYISTERPTLSYELEIFHSVSFFDFSIKKDSFEEHYVYTPPRDPPKATIAILGPPTMFI